ncbi:hypothetical protein Vafri_14052 [Volvox africanus]|nr:hypothetical protein Vafri_14052 [Volvox africanus]
MRGWWDRFPHPPLGLLTRLQDLLSLHDAPLAAHFNTYRGGLAGVVWPQLATLWTELLTRSDWLRLWDHCITAGPDLLYFFVVAYFISLRAQVMGMDTDHKLANWMAGPPPVDMGEILKVAYLLRNRTPEALRPTSSEWQPLPQGPTYTEFKEFPAGAVELFAADRKRIKESEDAIMRRRAVVSELEMRTRAVAMQAASLSTERQQLAALEEQRRAMLRQLEADTATEMARLDDRAKEEKLKQIAAVEKAYQANLLEVRATWHRELEFARAETAHKRAMAAQQLRSRQEDEQIKALEFHAQQRMREMEDDVRRTAVASAVRDELLAQQIEVEAKQRAKLKEWEIDDELRKQRLQHENERRAQLAMAAEEGAARSAAALEAQALAIQVEDHVMKVDGQRRLRRMAEDAALTTAEARAAEDARMAAREAADQEAMRLRARADMAWYEAEQMRREQFLEQERQQMEAAADAARRKLVDTEAAARTMAAQSELLERRRHLERQNAAEEAQTRRLVGVMAMERGRDAVLVSDLEAKEGEMKANLEHYARVGSMQREVEATEAAAAVALLAKLDEQQRRELIELRKLHEAALERLARDLEGQAADAAAKRRAELRAEHLAAIRVHQQAFARRKEELNRDLIREQGRRLRKAAEAAAAAAAAEAADGGGDTPREDHPPPPPPPPPPCDHNQNMYESVPSPPLWRHQQSAGGRRVPTQSAAAATGGGGDVNVSDKDSGGGSGGGGGGGGGAGFRPPAAVAADAARHTDMVLRALGIGSETSTAPTASDSSAHGPRITPVGTVTGSDGFAFTPRRQHHHTYDFLSDSNLTPASFISSVTTSLAPSPERFVFRRPPVATVASAMAPPGVATATATATATVTATPASTDVELQGPMMEVAAAVEQEHTQGSVAGGWPPGVGPTRPRSAAAAAAGAVATSPASVVSGTASTDTLSQSRETALPRSTSAGSGAAAASGGGGGGSTTTSGSAGAGSGGGGGGGGTAAAASAEAAKSLGPCRSWPGAVMPSALPPLREEQEEEDEEPLCFVTPSLSPSSFLPLITPSTRGATSTSTSITSFLNSSTSHAFRSNLDRPGSATAAKQRAALTFTRVVSPTQQQQRSQQQQSSGTRESTCSPSSVTGGSSANPGGAVLIEEYGHVSQRHTAGGGVVTSGSSLLDTSTNMATAAAAPPTQHFTDSDEGMQQSGLRGGPSQGAVNAGEAFVSKAGVMTTTTTTTTATVTATATGTSSPSSSWSSLQRSGLLGLSQPLNPPPVLPLPQQQQQQPSQGQAAPSGSWYGTGRYDTAAVSGRDAIAALAAAALDTISTTTGMTSLTSISTFTSHISFTPAVVRYQQQQQQQLSQQQSGSRQQQQQPQQSKSQFEAIATPASTASSSYSTAGTNPQADRGGGGAAAAATAAAASSDSVGHTGSGTEFSSGSSPWPPPPLPRQASLD